MSYTVNMEQIVIITISFLVGGIVGWVFGRRAGRAALPFTEENDEVTSASQVALTERTHKRHARILERAREAGRITNDGVEDLFCISDRTASVYLGQLVANGSLTRHSAGRGTYYTPNTANPAE